MLKYKYFDNIVSDTKTITGYDSMSHTLFVDILATHICTTLKQVCDITTKMIIKNSMLKDLQ